MVEGITAYPEPAKVQGHHFTFSLYCRKLEGLYCRRMVGKWKNITVFQIRGDFVRNIFATHPMKWKGFTLHQNAGDARGRKLDCCNKPRKSSSDYGHLFQQIFQN